MLFMGCVMLSMAVLYIIWAVCELACDYIETKIETKKQAEKEAYRESIIKVMREGTGLEKVRCKKYESFGIVRGHKVNW